MKKKIIYSALAITGISSLTVIGYYLYKKYVLLEKKTCYKFFLLLYEKEKIHQ